MSGRGTIVREPFTGIRWEDYALWVAVRFRGKLLFKYTPKLGSIQYTILRVLIP
jgi:hypothetical protein